MFKNYFKVAFRNLTKQKYYSAVNIFGLAFGIAASVLIFLWIAHEISYDRFYKDYQRIYRLTSDASLGGQFFDINAVPSPFAEQLAEECPEVEKATRISHYFDFVFKYKDTYYKEKKVIAADSNFFSLFGFHFVEGNPEKPFENNKSIILTKSMAKKFFGDEKAIGNSFEIDNQPPFVVSAVIDDMPYNSHLKFSMILYLDDGANWGNFNRVAYIKLKENSTEANVKMIIKDIVSDKMVTVMSEYFGTTPENFGNSGNFINVYLQPVKSVHLEPTEYGEEEPSGNKTYVIFFFVIAILILFVAGINYMNLSTAYYDTRLTEVGIRKSNGATPFTLVWQFLTETALLSLAAFMLAWIIIQLSFPFFKDFLELPLNNTISRSWYFSLSILLLVFFLGIVSGIIPAIKISRHKTVSTIKNTGKNPFIGLFSNRSILVVFQFVVTIVVIIATIFVQKQVKYMLNKDLGFKKEQLVILEGANSMSHDKKDVLKKELKTSPFIANVTFSDTYPGESYNNITGYGIEGDAPGNQFVLRTIFADCDYFKTYGMEIKTGREFDETDKYAIILNENAVKLMGFNNTLEKKIHFNGNVIPIVGIVKNFNHDPLNINLEPILIQVSNNQYMNYITIRISESNIKESMQFIQKKWKEVSGNMPFEYQFLDEKLQSAYTAEKKAGKVFLAFSVLSIIIACMGILGIASFIIQRRIKEIGIRKANGARTEEVMTMFLKDFLKWVVIAYVVACPLAWLATNKWLQNFSYKTNLSWWVFILAGIIAITIAIGTIFWQSWLAANRNPVDALRYE